MRGRRIQPFLNNKLYALSAGTRIERGHAAQVGVQHERAFGEFAAAHAQNLCVCLLGLGRCVDDQHQFCAEADGKASALASKSFTKYSV